MGKFVFYSTFGKFLQFDNVTNVLKIYDIRKLITRDNYLNMKYILHYKSID